MTEEERLILLREQLAEVIKAISAILGGAQEYRIGTRSIKRPDLGLLYEERSRLEREIRAIEDGGGIFRLAYFEGR
ncbi:peptidylprolyl isomerase [Paenibacillus graminis]|uniref:peptidylprolyl isomerase n=1 Tax=Paenibacillus graminis TaxID=189425 RepID=UPI002DB9835D|nr:peptidylprolyl isomerase [Paenibacillus graminis]MEC0171158.1 peptidylprolyl isomerase [Paenibacillus graminis]